MLLEALLFAEENVGLTQVDGGLVSRISDCVTLGVKIKRRNSKGAAEVLCTSWHSMLVGIHRRVRVKLRGHVAEGSRVIEASGGMTLHFSFMATNIERRRPVVSHISIRHNKSTKKT